VDEDDESDFFYDGDDVDDAYWIWRTWLK
jgi:hypothetical protein